MGRYAPRQWVAACHLSNGPSTFQAVFNFDGTPDPNGPYYEKWGAWGTVQLSSSNANWLPTNSVGIVRCVLFTGSGVAYAAGDFLTPRPGDPDGLRLGHEALIEGRFFARVTAGGPGQGKWAINIERTGASGTPYPVAAEDLPCPDNSNLVDAGPDTTIQSGEIVVPTTRLPDEMALGSPDDRCGPILTDAFGQPEVVVVLLDGVGSEEPNDGQFYPLPLDQPGGGAPTVFSYCPVDANGAERDPDHGWPDGLSLGLRRWSEFSVPGGSSGGSSNPSTSSACDANTAESGIPVPTPLPLPQPDPLPAPPPQPLPGVRGGLTTDSCLVARLASAGAVLLPYSYSGATLESTASGPLFTFHGYDVGQSKQDVTESIRALDDELASIHSVWNRAGIIVVGHSDGGLIASLWWEWWKCSLTGCTPGQYIGDVVDRDETFPLGTPAGGESVSRVFSLDGPINGVENCGLSHVVVGQLISDAFCQMWNHRCH